jgi:hypothetical protein
MRPRYETLLPTLHALLPVSIFQLTHKLPLKLCHVYSNSKPVAFTCFSALVTVLFFLRHGDFMDRDRTRCMIEVRSECLLLCDVLDPLQH